MVLLKPMISVNIDAVKPNYLDKYLEKLEPYGYKRNSFSKLYT